MLELSDGIKEPILFNEEKVIPTQLERNQRVLYTQSTITIIQGAEGINIKANQAEERSIKHIKYFKRRIIKNSGRKKDRNTY
jgi:hypothetical protein